MIKYSATVEKKVAGKAKEAFGLLKLITPLLNKAGKLTEAEQKMMVDTVESANNLLDQVTADLRRERIAYYDAEKKASEVTLVRKG